MRWDVFCRVVDNFGDIGFTWRLAADLAGRGEGVRLVVDDASALAWMACAAPVEVVGWEEATANGAADVQVETFGCGLPDGFADAGHPVRINVEHLSAEPFVARSHGLPSPREVAGRATTTWFYYPGFGAGTGGLLREPGLLARRAGFTDGRSWLAERGIERSANERLVSLFSYVNPALPALLDALAERPTRLLLAPGAAAEQAALLLGPKLRHRALRATRLPFLSQAGYDRLLWSCDLNLVRGEDSLVRSIWAGAPFVWQLYPQADTAHRAKLVAFLGRFLDGADAALAEPVTALFEAWNGAGDPAPGGLPWPDAADWALHCRGWRDRLAAHPDLTTQLLEFAAAKR